MGRKSCKVSKKYNTTGSKTMTESVIHPRNEQILISIITATYNAEPSLENLIKSVILQKTKEIEFIIIDGGSKDNTIEIVKKYESHLKYWISEPDDGVYDAWNKGVSIAKGEYIMFLGADDLLLPGALAAYIHFLGKKGHNFDIISSKLDYVNVHGEHLRFVGEPWNWNKFKMNRMSFAHPGMLHNERLFIKNGSFDTTFKICGDFEILLRTHDDIITGFMDIITVKMQQGGVSYSVKAIVETSQIRKNNRTLSTTKNRIRFLVLLTKFYVSKMKQVTFSLLQK